MTRRCRSQPPACYPCAGAWGEKVGDEARDALVADGYPQWVCGEPAPEPAGQQPRCLRPTTTHCLTAFCLTETDCVVGLSRPLFNPFGEEREWPYSEMVLFLLIFWAPQWWPRLQRRLGL